MSDGVRRPWLWPLVPAYGAGLRLADALRPPPRTLGWPVVSVGSLSAGGAGKTPVVLMLSRLLAGLGVGCDVLSRGYGRTARGVERVDPAGEVERFGDEPLEMAQAGLEVWVGADRFAAGLAAERASAQRHDGARVHLLDDGFQHRRLARSLDVVLLTLDDVRDTLLPAGNLREPLPALGRAGVLVVRQEEAASLEPWTSGRETWVIRRTMQLPADAPARPVAFCGIARPANFFDGLAGLGCAPAARVAFPDHHRYRDTDIAKLLAAAQTTGADGLVTTAKDAVKLSDTMRAMLGRLVVAELSVQPLSPEAVKARLRAVLQTSA